jgi:hypothetical protein
MEGECVVKIWTYEEIENKIKRDLDLQDEDFITTDELAGYCNDAIDEAEAEIITLFEDYFLKTGTLAMVNGASDIDLPLDIYAQKVRGLIYDNGSIIYPVRFLKGRQEFEEIALTNLYAGSEEYRYKLLNQTAGEQSKIRLFPPSRDTGNYLKIWYIRNAQRVPLVGEDVSGTPATRVSQLATLVDIPEFVGFIIAFMKVRCVSKEFDPRYNDLVAELQHQREMMTSTLKSRVPDNHQDMVENDLSFYLESN